MADYTELVKDLRYCASTKYSCVDCPHNIEPCCENMLLTKAADAIEELLEAAKKMHTWIFLNTGDEQAAYDECGLTDEMNAVLGYSGQIELRVEPPKEAQT